MPVRHLPCKTKTCKVFGEYGPRLVGLACSQCPTWRMAQHVRCTWKGPGMLISNTNSSHHCRTMGSRSRLHTASPTVLDTFLQVLVIGSYHGTVTLLCVWGLGIKPPALETGGSAVPLILRARTWSVQTVDTHCPCSSHEYLEFHLVFLAQLHLPHYDASGQFPSGLK